MAFTTALATPSWKLVADRGVPSMSGVRLPISTAMAGAFTPRITPIGAAVGELTDTPGMFTSVF
jgi:hypothetical protein